MNISLLRDFMQLKLFYYNYYYFTYLENLNAYIRAYTYKFIISTKPLDSIRPLVIYYDIGCYQLILVYKLCTYVFMHTYANGAVAQAKREY